MQDFTLDFYMRQTWQDPRLAFGELRLGGSDKPITSLTVRLWSLTSFSQFALIFEQKPHALECGGRWRCCRWEWTTWTDYGNRIRSSQMRRNPSSTSQQHITLFFGLMPMELSTQVNGENEWKKIFFTKKGTSLTLKVFFSLTVTATCPMKLQLFPMDSQRCKLEIESCEYLSTVRCVRRQVAVCRKQNKISGSCTRSLNLAPFPLPHAPVITFQLKKKKKEKKKKRENDLSASPFLSR